MELHIFKVGSRCWIFKKSRKLGEVLTEPRFRMKIVAVVATLMIMNDCCR
jgi:hypothetical protein